MDAAQDTLSGLNGDSLLGDGCHLYGTVYHSTEAEIQRAGVIGRAIIRDIIEIQGLSYEVGLAAAGFRTTSP